jgi:hypothetical protein
VTGLVAVALEGDVDPHALRVYEGSYGPSVYEMGSQSTDLAALAVAGCPLRSSWRSSSRRCSHTGVTPPSSSTVGGVHASVHVSHRCAYVPSYL